MKKEIIFMVIVSLILIAVIHIVISESMTISEKEVITDSLLKNITVEGNFTHLNISEVAPYDNLTGYWSFDGDMVNAKTTTHYDLTKNNTDGTGLADALVDSTNCMGGFGNCLQLDGTGDSVNMGTVLTDQEPFSLMAWCYIDDADPGDGSIFAKRGQNDPGWWDWHYSGFGAWTDALRFQKDTNGGAIEVVSDNNVFSQQTWHHIALTWGGAVTTTSVKMYVDGSEVGYSSQTASGTLPESDATNELEIGAVTLGVARNYKGQIDEAMFFSTNLTDAQILEIYNNQSARFVTTGTEKVRAVKITNGTNWDGQDYNRVNLTVDYQANKNSNLSARIGQINLSVNNSDLVLYMPFEWGSAVDISGNGSDGTFGGDAFINQTGGLNDTFGLQVDGNGDYVELTNEANFDFNTSFSIALWLKRGDTSNPVRIINKPGDGGYYLNSFSIGFSDSPVNVVESYFWSTGGSSQSIQSTSALTDTVNWHHVSVVWNSTYWLMYIDGVLNNTAATTGFPNSSSKNVFIGSADATNEEYKGLIDEVMIFNRSLSATEISTLYNKTINKTNIAYYTDYQNITGNPTEFTINTEADFIFPDFLFHAGNSTNQFYTPILNGTITFETWNVPDTTEPGFATNQTNASSTTYNGTDVQINLTINDETAIDFFTLSHNDTVDTCTGTLDCTQYTAELPCENCSQCDWTAGTKDTFNFSDFDPGWDGWEDGGADAVLDTGVTNCGSNSIVLDRDSGNASSSWIYLDFSGYSTVEVNFSFFLETTIDENECLNLRCEESIIDSWGVDSDLSDCGNNVATNKWLNGSIILTDGVDCAFSSATLIRFESTSSGNGEEFWFDCVNFSGAGAGSCGATGGGDCSNCKISDCDTNCSAAGCSVLPAGTWTNESLVDAGDTSPINMVWNYSIEGFPLTGGTMGWRVWANDTGGYVNVSNIYTFVVQDSSEDTSPPTYSDPKDNSTASTPTNGTDVQLNITIDDVTAIDYFRLAVNDTLDGTWLNQSIVDADDATSLTAIFNYSIYNFSLTGGTMGWQVWANDTGGYVSVSTMQTVTIRATDSCSCPGSGNDWNIINGDICTWDSGDGICDLGSSNNFRVLDGKMRIGYGGYIRASGCYVNDSQSLYVNDSGGLYCQG